MRLYDKSDFPSLPNTEFGSPQSSLTIFISVFLIVTPETLYCMLKPFVISVLNNC